MLERYLSVADAGYTHMIHLMIVDERVQRVRLRRYEELSRRGRPACMSESTYQLLLAGLPAEWRAVLEDASALLAERLQRGAPCSLGDLANAFSLPKGTWVRLPDATIARVGAAGDVEGQAWTVSPTGRLVQTGKKVGVEARQGMEEAFVWSAVWRAHSDADEEQQERRKQRGLQVKAVPELVYGGLVVQPTLLNGGAGHVVGSVNAGQWALLYRKTDRLRPAVPFAAADVAHLYSMQLAHAHEVPRALALGHASETSTSWVDMLDHPEVKPEGVRLTAFGALCEPCLPRWTRECHWRVLVDAWPIGNGRCGKKGESRELCEICFRMGRGEGMSREEMLTSFRETTRHVRLECPYAMAVVDTAARAVALAVGAPPNARQALAAEYLREMGAAMVTGHRGKAGGARGPFAVMVAELSRVLMERQQHNAAGALLDCDAANAYQRLHAAFEEVLQQSWREAQEREGSLLMWMSAIPEEDTPTERWRKEWKGFFKETGRGMALALPPTRAEVAGAEDAIAVRSQRVLAGVSVQGARITLRLRVASVLAEASIGPLSAPATVLTAAAERSKAALPLPPAELLRRGAGVLTVYVDGSGESKGGWGVVVVSGGRGGQDRDATEIAEHYGPLVLDPTAAPFLGVEKASNNTAELTALCEGLAYLAEVDGTTTPAIVRPDSEYARDLALGLSKPRTNVALARRVRNLWQAEEARRGGQLWALHVKGHSGHVWNERADRAAARGAAGYVRGVGARWSSWPPLSARVLRAHEIGEAQRVLRAKHAFGVLAVPVPVHGETVPVARLLARLARVERRLEEGVQSPRVAWALRRARAAYQLLSDAQKQRDVARRLVREGLQPETSTTECKVNVAALRRYVQHAGPEADAIKYDKRGKPRGTLRELARKFVDGMGARETVRLAYRHALLGAELVAAGFVCASREYVYGSALDPFRLPKEIRAFALARRGRDMDDSASYPRACLDVFRAGRAESLQYLGSRDDREAILAGIGLYYFGSGVPAKVRRERAKQLFNALDNDGTVWGWRRRFGVPDGSAPLAGACVRLGNGQMFSLRAYEQSRADLTEEFEELMPGMTTFVNDWRAARGDPPKAVTAKSYFLQEAEGLSRRAKVEWARVSGGRRGRDVPVTNLDGKYVAPAECMRYRSLSVGNSSVYAYNTRIPAAKSLYAKNVFPTW